MKKKLGLSVIAITLVLTMFLTVVLATNDVISAKAEVVARGKDAKVLECQKWLNKTYKGKKGYVVIKEDGIVGSNTTKALVRALQFHLRVDVDGVFGIGSVKKFREVFNELTVKTKKCHVVKLMQYALYCK